jgi:hypothetical protein
MPPVTVSLLYPACRQLRSFHPVKRQVEFEDVDALFAKDA